MSKKVYYHTAYSNDPKEFAAVGHGMLGYNPTLITTQEEANLMNAMQGITSDMASVAIGCSMNDNWDEFDKLVSAMAES